MSIRAFSSKEKNVLKKNKYIKNVGNKAITYTKEFKILFLKEKEKGKEPFEIFKDAGFDIDILGSNRVTTFNVRVTRDGVEDRRKGNSGRPRKNIDE